MSSRTLSDLPPEQPTPQQHARYWSAFAITMAGLVSLALWWMYSPGQDFFGSIPLDGDGRWFHNYEPAKQIQDQDVLWNGIGHSIENAQQADIIFVGASTVLFGIDWRLFEAFEQKHHIKMFNEGLAGFGSGAFSLRLAQKWNLHPKLWIINVDEYQGNFANSYFYMTALDGGVGGTFKPAGDTVHTPWLRAYRDVLGRNIGWRFEMDLGGLQVDPYRSAVTGNWYLDYWKYQLNENNATIVPWSGPVCPEKQDEIDGAKKFLREIGGEHILMLVPSVIACNQRVKELGEALGVSAFTVDPTQFSSGDGGGHLDRRGSIKYSKLFFAWLEQQAEFQKLFPADRDAATQPAP